MTTYRTIDERLTDADVALTNAQADAAVLAALTEYGYDETRLTEGLALLDAARSAQDAHAAAYGEQFDATDAFKAAYAEAQAPYMRYLKVARLALADVRGAGAALDLYGRRKQTVGDWLEQARQFYANALADPDVLAALATYNVTQEKLQAGLVAVEAAAAANQAQEQDKGEAQQATQDRDAAVDALDAWMSTFLQVARVALEDTQQLEKLGITARA